MAQRLMMFMLPFAVVLVSWLAAVVSVQLVPVSGARLVTVACYYAAIGASVVLVRRAVPEARRAPFLYSGRRASGRRVVLAIVLPAVPVLLFLLLKLAPVSPTVVVAAVVFAAVNASFEETFWRGVMAHLPASDRVRILYPAAVFGLAHWCNVGVLMPLSTRSVVLMVGSAFLLGVLWMWFYLRERSLLYPIASHFATDVFAVLALAMSMSSRMP